MSLPITNYTSYDSVRAALGVSSDDLEDATLALDIYADALELEFDDATFKSRNRDGFTFVNHQLISTL